MIPNILYILKYFETSVNIMKLFPTFMTVTGCRKMIHPSNFLFLQELVSFVQCSKIKFSSNRLVETDRDELPDKIGPDFTVATTEEPSQFPAGEAVEELIDSSPTSSSVGQSPAAPVEDGNSTFSLDEGPSCRPEIAPPSDDVNSTFSIEESRSTNSVGQNSGDSTFVLEDNPAGESTFVVEGEEEIQFDEISANVQNVLSTIEMSAKSASSPAKKRLIDNLLAGEASAQPPTPPKKSRQDFVGQKENPSSLLKVSAGGKHPEASASDPLKKDPLKINNA